MLSKYELKPAVLFMVIVLLTGPGLFTGCSDDPEAKLAAAIPGIDRTTAFHLTTSDDSTLARYARSAGIYPIRKTGSSIIARFHAENEESFHRVKSELSPVLERIAKVYEREFDSERFAKELRFWSAVSAEDAVRLNRLRSALTASLKDTTVTTTTRIEQVRRLLTGYRSIGYTPGIAICEHELGNILAGTDKAEQRRHYRRALTDAESASMYIEICQILGTMGHEAAVAGRTDSMFYYWNRSREIAERHKLPDYTARIYEFYARHYQTAGRLALAHDLLNEAVSTCGRFFCDYRALRFVVKLIEFYNDLGCWDISGRLLQQASALEQRVPENYPGGTYPPELRARLARARYLMAKDDLDGAEVILTDIKPYVRQQPNRDQYPNLLYTWSEDLFENGHADKALPLIEEGLARAKEVNLPYFIPLFHILRARLESARDDYAAALSALSLFEDATEDWPRKYESEWLVRDAIRVRALLSRGEPAGAANELSAALRRMESYLEDWDASAHGYLWLGNRGELRELLHTITRNDPAAEYGAELYWRNLYQRLGNNAGSNAPVLTIGASMDSTLHALAADARSRLGDTGHIHCVYYLDNERPCRITVTRGSVRVDRLSATIPDMQRLVSTVWELMSDVNAGSQTSMPDALVTPLRALALQLLPAEVLDTRPAEPRTLFISTDRFLGSLPFETLNLAADGGYRPLLESWDVAYLRGTVPVNPKHKGSAELLIADPALPASIQRRLSVSQPLANAPREAEGIAAFLENPITLSGTAATKKNLSGAWENASMVYVAAHFLANPEVPYLTMLPLAASGDGNTAPDASILDAGDVRAANLGGCELVVLSGCATGAPYITAKTTGPAFGDIFLDAGAGAVVQTHWAVRDEWAASLMTEFVRTWRSSGHTRVRALCDVRRSALKGPGGTILHPFYWAAFTIKLGNI